MPATSTSVRRVIGIAAETILAGCRQLGDIRHQGEWAERDSVGIMLSRWCLTNRGDPPFTNVTSRAKSNAV